MGRDKEYKRPMCLSLKLHMIWKWILDKKFKRRYKKTYYTAWALIFFGAYAWITSPRALENITRQKKEVEQSLIDSMIQDKATGCQMPLLKLFSDDVLRYQRDQPPQDCGEADWVECYNAECRVSQRVLDAKSNVVCTYRDIIYMNDTWFYLGKPTNLVGEAVYKLSKSDFVKISCTGGDKTGSPLKMLIGSSWEGHTGALRPVPIPRPPPGREDSPDVVIIGFDSISRNGFMRRMPRAYKLLTEEFGAVVLESYNVLEDGTPAALFPLLAGRGELDTIDPTMTLRKDNKFDPNEFIFYPMRSDGYRTAYLEDNPLIGTFQLRFQGFSAQPADHYLYAMLKEDANAHNWDIFNRRHCIGHQMVHKWMLNLTEQFLKMDGKHFILNFMVAISHDNFNWITYAEDDLINFLRKFKSEGRMRNSLLIVMSDHGSRFRGFRDTYQGRVEERLPFISINLPETFIEKNPKALEHLRGNKKVLTTALDLHRTILEVVGKTEIFQDGYILPGSDIKRTLSMLEPIPSSRTCGEAGIPPHWCACTKWYDVNYTDTLYERSAFHLGWYINELTKDVRGACRERKLLRIEWVMTNSPNREIFGSSGWLYYFRRSWPRYEVEYYQAKIVMSPNEAVFEGSLRYDVRRDRLTISERDISRVDAYGSDPRCITDKYPHLNKFCFCNRDLFE